MLLCVFFFFNDTATTEIYTLSLHDALPICSLAQKGHVSQQSVEAWRPAPKDSGAYMGRAEPVARPATNEGGSRRSEEHTSELQSRQYLVCRLLLEKKKTILSHYLHALDSQF